MLTFDEAKHEYKESGLTIPSVTQIISDVKLIDLSFINEDLLKEKAELGNNVHLTTEMCDNDKLDISRLHPVLMAYLNQWIKFKKDFNFLPLEIEPMYYHSAYKFAGRIDRVGFIEDKKSIIDLKTGMKFKSHAIQTAGYKLLYNFKREKGEMAKRRYCVYLTEDSYKVEENKEQTDEAVFLAALTIYNYKRSKQ